jgi:hypothetical protein
VGQATQAAQGAGGGGGGSGGKKSLGASIGESVTKGIDAMMKRFDAGMNLAIASDVYASRMAAYSGSSVNTGSDIFRQQGKQGFGFMASSFEQGNKVQYMGTGIGAYMGASGRPGQRFGAYAQSIKQMQEVMPGLDAEQGANAQAAIFNNVQGIKLSRILFGGSAITPNKPNGEAKTQNEYFRDVLGQLQKLPRPNGQHGAWTRQEIMQMNFPGSRLNAWLSAILPPEVMPMWYEWAINNALSVEKGQGELSNDPKIAKSQLERAGRGRSLATNAQETTNREAQKDALFAGEGYGAMNARLDYEKKMLGVLQHIDTMFSGLYGILGRTPSMLQGAVSGSVGGIVGGATDAILGPWLGLFGGDPGYANMGDPEGGTSHLTPDLRKRVNNMMSANPNLRISSAYRDNKRQGDLQGRGPFAPSGKSKHGRGQAVDFANQHGWIAKNAKKFGLEAANRYGEPWHVQLAGTLNMGDPQDAARLAEQEQTKALIGKVTAAWAQGAATGGASGSTGTPSSGSQPPSGYPPGQSGALSADQMVQLLHEAGFQGEALVKMAGISRRESGWNPGAFNPDASTGDNSLGLWQINVLGNLAAARLPLIKKAGGSKVEDLYDPLISAKVAYQMWESGGFHPWGPYKGVSELHNVKDEWLQEARQAAEAHGYMGDVGYAAPAGNSGGGGVTTIAGGTSVTFQNTFNLSFPNGASKQSIDVAARQVAARLEPQLRRMITRTN